MATEEKQIDTTIDLNKAKSAQEAGTVRYIGGAGTRIISVVDWKKLGIEDQEKTQWDDTNNWVLPTSDFAEDAISYLKTDSGFQVKGS